MSDDRLELPGSTLTLTRREALLVLRCALAAALDPGLCPWCGQDEGHTALCGGSAALRLADRMLEQEQEKP